MSVSKTVVISCAGMGSRLGLGKTKALIKIEDKSIIIRQLELLKDVKDVRIVIGYQFQDVIEEVLRYRRDIVFVFNHQYLTTSTGSSFYRGSIYSNDLVISLDGDLLVHPEDMKIILDSNFEFVAGCEVTTQDPVFLKTKKNNDGSELAVSFSREQGNYEWTGLVQLRKENILPTDGYVYSIIEPLLPLPVLKIRAKEIDTNLDYTNAKNWIKRGYSD